MDAIIEVYKDQYEAIQRSGRCDETGTGLAVAAALLTLAAVIQEVGDTTHQDLKRIGDAVPYSGGEV